MYHPKEESYGPTNGSHVHDVVTWPTFVSHVSDTGAMVPPAGPTLVTWRHGPVGGSHNHEVGHGPTNGSHEHDMAPWWHLFVPRRWCDIMVPRSGSLPAGPTVMTWHRGPRSYPVDVATGSHSDFILFAVGVWIPQPFATYTSELPLDHSIICVVILYVALFI